LSLNAAFDCYFKTRDTLSLLSSGTGGIEQLQTSLTEDDAYFAFVREEKAYALINFFPAGIPGVRRGKLVFTSLRIY